MSESPRVAICAMAKNEGRYLEEWVVYHHLLGFAPIVVYNHESTDDSAAVLDSLAAEGLAAWVQWSAPPKKKPQWVAYEDAMVRLKGRTDWIAFIDLDEFFVLPRHETIQDFLREHGDRGAIAVNWKMFGSSGLEHHEPGLVIERFTGCAKRTFKGNHAVKTLARFDLVETPRVHTCHFALGTVYQTVLGEEIGFMVGTSDEVSHDIIRLNHYFTRSREEWTAKATRGRGAKPADHPKKHRTWDEFERNDRNEREEHDILRRAPRLHAALERRRSKA